MFSQPEYGQFGRITVKLDAFSLGIVFLELLTGRSPMEDLRSLVQEQLADPAQPFKEVLDPKVDDCGLTASSAARTRAMTTGAEAAATERGPRQLAQIALELTLLDDKKRLTATDALPRLEALLSHVERTTAASS